MPARHAVGSDRLPGHRTTESAPVPEGWTVVRLGEVAAFSRRPRDLAGEQRGRVPFIPMALVPDDSWYVGAWELRESAESQRGVFVQDGDILLAKITPCLENGKQAVARGLPGGWCYATTEVFALRASASVSGEFLALYLKLPGVRQALAEKMEGTTARQRLPKAVLQSLLIPLPPLPEQRAIAGLLSAVQWARETTRAVRAATRELKKSLVRHLFTYGLVAHDKRDQVQLQHSQAGTMPAHWAVLPLGEVVQQTRQTDPRNRPGWRFKYIDVSSVSAERLRIERYTEYEGKDAPSRARKSTETGDVIFATVRPYLRRVARVPEHLDAAICSTAFCVIRPDPGRVDAAFAFQAIASDSFVARVSRHQRGSSYPAVSDRTVLSQTVPLPPLPEQRAIARILQAVDRKIEAEETRSRALETLFTTLLHHLMTGKVRVADRSGISLAR